MKVNREKLIAALKIANKVTKKGNQNFPALRCVLLDGPGQRLVATDLEISVMLPLTISDFEKEVPAEIPDISEIDDVDELRAFAERYDVELSKSIKKADTMRVKITAALHEKMAGETKVIKEQFVLPCEDLKKIVESLTEEELEMTAEVEKGGIITRPIVRIGEKFQDLYTLDIGEYPVFEIPEMENSTSARVSLAEMMQVATATIAEDSGFKLSGVYFDLKERCIVATDSHRLHKNPIYAIEGNEERVSFFMPVDALGVIKAALPSPGKDETDEVTVEYDNGYFRIMPYDSALIAVRALESKFPDWKSVVKDPAHTIVVDKKAVSETMKQALALANESYGALKMKFNGGLDVEMVNPDKGSYQSMNVPVKAKSYPDDAEEIVVGLKGKYLADAIKALGEDEDVEIGFTGPSDGVSIHHNDYLALIMPTRV